jgi:molecular chaperone DnaK
VLLLDVTPLSLGVETLGGVMTKLIERNSTIPSRKTEIFSTAEDNQSAVDIHVLQGERELARDNRTLGQFRLEGIAPGARGTPQVEVTFDIDANGILNVAAKDMASGKEQKITISGSTSLDKSEIDKMIRDAEQHAAEDKRRRELVEARNNADSLAYSVERAIKDMGDRLPPHERARAESLINDIRSALKDESTTIDRLRQLTSDLQQVSHSLASAAYSEQASAAGAGAGPGSSGGRAAGGGDDDIIDAEYTPK